MNVINLYRHALRKEAYSFPRGFGEDGLSGDENACKEIKEEIGADVNEIHFKGNVVLDSGLCGDEVSIYFAEVSNIKFDKKEEGIEEIILVDKKELEEWFKKEMIDDGYTLAAYAMCREMM